jgi:putative ABC transport system permease protein
MVMVAALRTVARAPSASLFVIVVLTVSMSASVAIFALIDNSLLKPLPYPTPDRLVTFTYTFNGSVVPLASEAKFVVWQQFNRAIEEPTAVQFGSAEWTTADGLQRIRVGAVSAAFFRLFGTSFTVGRPFSDSELAGGTEALVILSHRFWQQQFGGDRAVVGRPLTLDGEARTVIGVAARFDSSLLGDQPDLWVPLRLNLANPQHPPFLSAYGRLRAGVSLRQAHEEDQRAAEEFRRRFPGVLAAADGFAVRGFSEIALADLRQPLGVVASAVALVLVLGCTNVAGLLLVQVTRRRREMAVRAALGGSRLQIAVQLLTESAYLTSVATALGAVLGLSGARALVALAPSTIPQLPDGASSLTVDVRFGAFVCVMLIVTTVACTVLPMLAVKSTPLVDALRGNAGTVDAGRRTSGVRAVIVGSQIALATFLMVGAALLGRTWWELQTVDRGFSLLNVATLRSSLVGRAEDASTERVSHVVDTVLERLGTVPGVVEAAATCCLPLESDWLTSVQVVGRSAITDADQLLSERRISPSYFRLLEIPLERGRAFDVQDRSTGSFVAIVNQAMAERFWPGQDPLGAHVRLFPGTAPDQSTVVRTIVGVVADVRDGLPMAERPRPTVYIPLAQVAEGQQDGEVAWLVRHRGTGAYDHRAVERAIRAASNGRPVFDVNSLEAIRTNATADTTLRAILLGLFSAAALCLVAAGVYGAVAATVRQRWHDMSVRLALGAQPTKLRHQVISDVLRVVMCGTSVGVLGAFFGSRVIRAFLFGVSATDHLVFASVAAVFTLVALLAAWVPASRVFRLNVTDLLRRD